MKLKVGDQVYLQKYDIAHITHDLNSFPAGIFEEIFGNSPDGIFIMSSPADGLRFDCVFKGPDTVEWLMNQDWLVNYETYAETPTSELASLVKRLDSELSQNVNAFNSKNEAYRKEHFEEASEQFDKERHVIISLQYLIDARNGKTQFVFPDDSPYRSVPAKKPNIFQRLFSRGAQ